MGAFDFELYDEDRDGRLIFDSVTHPGCDQWTIAHVDAVLGEVISPLAWTLVGPAFERSQARLWAALGVVPPTRDRRVRFSARLNGRLHIGLATVRTAAARFPGVDPTRTERELGIPASSRSTTWRDRAWYPIAVVGAATAALRAPLWTRRQRQLVRQAAVYTALEVSTWPSGVVVERVERLRRELVPVLLAHVFVRMATHSAIDRLRTHCADDDLAFGLLAGLPALEASQPSLALLGIAADARQQGSIDGPAIENFLVRCGHRGLNELDPTAPVWETQRPQLEAMIWRMAADDPENPVETGRATRTAALRKLRCLPAVRRRRIAVDARFARWLSVLGERSKSDVARHVNQLRRALTVLQERLHPHVDPVLTAMLSWQELRSATLGPGPVPVLATLDARRQALATATSDAAHATASKPVVLTGVAASPGTVAGTAVVVHDPTEDTDIGDILVAHSTDTAWTPLFLGKAAIVTDTGGVVSHTSIVARDFGIPAVVGTGNATTVIHTGDQTHVDGDAGRVEITP